MPQVVEYYFGPNSPWSYLGHARFAEIARRHGATVDPIPLHLGELFPLSGGLPLAKRPPQRQAYRMMELKRWREALGMPLTLEPKHFPVDPAPAVAFITAAKLGGGDAMALSAQIMAACWTAERDISDPAVLMDCAAACGLDGQAIAEVTAEAATQAAVRAGFERAVARGVFGAPTYGVGEELFWGQDRLDFVDRALAGA